MGMNDENRRRVLAEIVSLEAWHDAFSVKRERSDLHVDVAFLTGRIGGEPEAPVRFKLALKRAEVVVVVPMTEPARVETPSVSRDTPAAKVKATSTIATGRKTKARAKAGLTGLGAQGEIATSTARATKLAQSLDGLRITQALTVDGHHHWIVEPTFEGPLAGHPWPANKPRLRVVDTRADRARGIEPTIRVEVRCRREDLAITDIAPTDKTALAALLTDPLGSTKMKAAEAVIRTRLFKAGLLHEDADVADPYTRLTLCEVISEAQ